MAAGEDAAVEEACFEVTQAHRSLVQARHLVQELREVVGSARQYLAEAQIDAAKAELCDDRSRSGRFEEASADSMERVAARCRSGKEISTELAGTVHRAGEHVDRAAELVDYGVAGASEPGALAQQLEGLRDLLAVTQPAAEAASTNLACAFAAAAHAVSRRAGDAASPTAAGRGLSPLVAMAGQEVARADEDVRLADVGVDRAQGASARSLEVARQVGDTARARMAARHHDPAVDGPSGGHPVGR